MQLISVTLQIWNDHSGADTDNLGSGNTLFVFYGAPNGVLVHSTENVDEWRGRVDKYSLVIVYTPDATDITCLKN